MSERRKSKFRIWDCINKSFDAVTYYAGEQFGHPSSSDWIADQFIGLLDKNGIEIYEGDFLKRHNADPTEFHRTGPVAYVGPVVYCNWAAFVIRRGLDFKIDGDLMHLYEVIGNIHQHKFDDDSNIVSR